MDHQLNALRETLSPVMPYLRGSLISVIGDTRGHSCGYPDSDNRCSIDLSFRDLDVTSICLCHKGLAYSGPPLMPVTFAQAAWAAAGYYPQPFADRQCLPPVDSGKEPDSRVVWLIFDELSPC